MFFKFKYKPQKEYVIEAEDKQDALNKLVDVEITDFYSEFIRNIYCSECIVDETKDKRINRKLS